MSLQKNKIYRTEFTGHTAEGAAVAKINGMTVFVSGGAVGDQCDVKIIKVGKKLAFGKIEKIIIPSKHRIKPVCVHAGKCGGCSYQHITYEEELNAKKQKVADALSRIGGFKNLDVKITGADEITHYRNKAQFPVGEQDGVPYTGFYRPRSHDIVRADKCFIVKEIANDIAKCICDWMEKFKIPAYDESKKKGLIRHIYIRTGEISKEVQVCLITANNKIPNKEELINNLTTSFEQITSIVQNINKRTDNVILGDKTITLWGDDYLQDTLCSNVFKLSPHAFYQVNHAQTEKLYGFALEYANLTGKETVIDLYCGAGTITLALSSHAKNIIGVEIVPEAIENAKENAMINGVDNTEFICADAAQAALMLVKRGIKPDVLTVDPPRKGLSEQTIEAILQMNPERIVYISCDPATLARDCKLLCDNSYKIDKVMAVDLFPRTYHIETVVRLFHKKPDTHIELKIEFGDKDGEFSLDKIKKDSERYMPKKRVTYKVMQEYIEKKYGFKVHSAYIAEVKRSLGLPMYDAPNAVEELKNPRKHPTEEKVRAIKDALKHFEII